MGTTWAPLYAGLYLGWWEQQHFCWWWFTKICEICGHMASLHRRHEFLWQGTESLLNNIFEMYDNFYMSQQRYIFGDSALEINMKLYLKYNSIFRADSDHLMHVINWLNNEDKHFRLKRKILILKKRQIHCKLDYKRRVTQRCKKRQNRVTGKNS